MPFPYLPDTATDALKGAGSYVSRLLTPSVRLGVTGLARSGKTVFITALVRNLIEGGRLPFFAAHAENRILRAYLQPQPNDELPRFDYEQHVRALERDPPEWPASTRRISQLRVTIEYQSARSYRRALGPSALNLDIIDYPGEWLLDLALIEQSFAQWSDKAFARASDPRYASAAKPWLSHLKSGLSPQSDPEQTAIAGAGLYTSYLNAARTANDALSTAGPGRFLMPGDLEGSPLLTFFPLPADLRGANEALLALLEKRFEGYKANVARPFFRDYFSRLDRQIVLVDALSAMNAGAEAIRELDHSLNEVLRVFRPGANSWLSSITGRRVDRLMFAASKADHIHSTSHDRLEAILRTLTDRAIARAEGAGACVGVVALAALRAPREAEIKDRGQKLPCIRGVPMPGEVVGGQRLDGTKEVAIFPGDLPEDPVAYLDAAASRKSVPATTFVRFRPPRITAPAGSVDIPILPHIRLDRALDFLIGDWLK